MTFDAIVLAGGSAARLEGADKPAVTIAGRTLLDIALEACSNATRTVVVGPRRATQRDVMWVREEAPGSGPLAAIACGAAHVKEALAVVMAADLPFVDRDDLDSLVASLITSPIASEGATQGAIAVDANGRDQPLLGVYRVDALRRALDQIGALSGARVMDLLSKLEVAQVPLPRAARDCDTWEEIEAARKEAPTPRP
jgi:molybdopterin-guanine dinucleotide biosynthesis protein A